jgi:hypothetical protein
MIMYDYLEAWQRTSKMLQWAAMTGWFIILSYWYKKALVTSYCLSMSRYSLG